MGWLPALALIIFLETGAMVPFCRATRCCSWRGLYAAKGDLNIVVLNVLLSTMAMRATPPPI